MVIADLFSHVSRLKYPDGFFADGFYTDQMRTYFRLELYAGYVHIIESMQSMRDDMMDTARRVASSKLSQVGGQVFSHADADKAIDEFMSVKN